MAQALAVQTRSPEDAHAKFRLAIQGFDVFIDQVPQNERFQTLVLVSDALSLASSHDYVRV